MLLFVAVLAGKVAYRFGAPALLLFLGVGMLFGWDFISYRSEEITQFIGMISLCIILFTGGMDTSFREIRPVIGRRQTSFRAAGNRHRHIGHMGLFTLGARLSKQLDQHGHAHQQQ